MNKRLENMLTSTSGIDSIRSGEQRAFLRAWQRVYREDGFSIEELNKSYSFVVEKGLMDAERILRLQHKMSFPVHEAKVRKGAYTASTEDVLTGGHPAKLLEFVFYNLPSFEQVHNAKELITHLQEDLLNPKYEGVVELFDMMLSFYAIPKNPNKPIPSSQHLGIENLRRLFHEHLDHYLLQASELLHNAKPHTAQNADDLASILSKKICIGKGLYNYLETFEFYEQAVYEEHKPIVRTVLVPGKSIIKSLSQKQFILDPFKKQTRYLLTKLGMFDAHLRMFSDDPHSYRSNAETHERNRVQPLIDAAVKTENFERAAHLQKELKGIQENVYQKT